MIACIFAIEFLQVQFELNIEVLVGVTIDNHARL